MLLFILLNFMFFSCGNETKKNNIEKNNTIITLQEVESACIQLTACSLEHHVTRCIQKHLDLGNIGSGSFFDQYFKFSNIKTGLQKKLTCIKDATSCLEMDACNGVERTNETCNGLGSLSCEDDIITSCVDGKKIKQDCKQLHLKCVNLGGEENLYLKCSPKAEGIYCDDDGGEDTYESTCIDSKTIKHCKKNQLIKESCEYLVGKGSSCYTKTLSSGDKYTKCLEKEDGDSCDEDSYGVVCEGSTLKYCGKNNTIQEIDCKKIKGDDFICENRGLFYEDIKDNCVYKNNVSLCDNNSISCDGDTLVYCMDNKEKRFNCKDHGYSSCATSNSLSKCEL